MKIAILCIGDELLRGSTVNQNLALIGQELRTIALFSELELTIPDLREAIFRALEFILPGFDIIITTGGLGPTADDVTKPAVADYLGLKLVEDSQVAASLKKYLNSGKIGNFPQKIMNQALVPDGAAVLANRAGTAPGLHIRYAMKSNGESKDIFMLPGPPYEAMPIFREFVIPYLKSAIRKEIHTEIIYSVGIPESILEERVSPLMSDSPEISIAYCASPETVKIFLSGKDKDSVKNKSEQLKSLLKECALSQGYCSVAEELSAILRNFGLRISIAESCTGGMLAGAITDLPGASDILDGSIVVYSNRWKIKLLDVKKDTLKNYGAVSGECAEEMVDNLCSKYGTDVGIALTGIAGPNGASLKKPVGLVFIATKYKKKSIVEKYNFSGNREMVRRRALTAALNQLRKQILLEHPHLSRLPVK